MNFVSMWKRFFSPVEGAKGRIFVVFLGLLLFFIWEGITLAHLHLADHAKISHPYVREFKGLRGRIFDRNGEANPLALSVPVWEFFLDPKVVETNKETIAEVVSRNLKVEPDWVMEQFKRTGAGSRHIKLGRSNDREIHDALLTFRGIGADEIIIRKYPYGKAMSHVLGFVNAMDVGGAGIEQTLNTELSGAPGVIRGEKDAKQREIYSRRNTYAPPIPGHDVHLTLDLNIQNEVEKALREVIEKFHATRGWSIVEKVHTGEILSLATYPDYEPENYTKYTEDEYKNYALCSVYEPGSIMKAITASAFLNERLGTPNTLINAEQGIWFYAGKPLRDHATGYITVSRAIKKSSNIVCAKIGLMLGDHRLYAYLRAFNFGSKFNIGLPGEEAGILPNPKNRNRWSKLTPTRITIGQGIGVTGLQMVSAYSALANEGKMMQPYIIDKIVTANGEVIRKSIPKVIGRPVRPEVAREVCQMLKGVTEPDGTGRRAAVRGYSVAGKTGTAQKAGCGGYSHTDYYASFVGFVPSQDPVFTLLITVEKPQPQHTGGFVAAPVFSKLAGRIAQYLEIPPDEPEELEEEWDDLPSPTVSITR